MIMNFVLKGILLYSLYEFRHGGQRTNANGTMQNPETIKVHEPLNNEVCFDLPFEKPKQHDTQ